MRETFTSKLGFTLAAIGSAVGLGNMWRFSYFTAEYGGAAFVLLYVVLTVLVGIPVLLAELVIGRGAQRGPVQALAHFGGSRWSALGGFFVLTGFLILAYYSVVAGWTVRYGWDALVSGFPENPAAHFGVLAQGHTAAAWHLGFMGATVAIVATGIRGGIERVSLIVMPLLFVVVVGIAIYAATLPGAGPGYGYYLSVDWSAALRFDVLRAAAGQAFFSLSLGMGAIMTYASYLDRNESLGSQSAAIAGADFAVAFIAGLMVFPLIFALGLSGQVIGTAGTENDIGNVGALFITLPEAFRSMEGAGRFVGVLFFGALAVGALTSAISVLEVTVTWAMERFAWNRKRSAWTLGAAIAALGLAPAYRTSILGTMDQFAGNLFVMFGGFGVAVFVGWRMRDPLTEAFGEIRDWHRIWLWSLRVPVPAILLLVTVYALLDAWRTIAGS